MSNELDSVMEFGQARSLERELAESRRLFALAERAWRMELDLAVRVHERMLPQPVRHPRIDIDARYRPASRVGGDYCQALFPNPDTCCISICDVTGHGVGPALLATRISSEVLRLTFAGRSPGEIVSELNQFVLRHFDGLGLDLSFFAARIDLPNRIVTYSGAGHPGPLLLRHECRDVEPLPSRHLLLGVQPDVFVTDAEASLELAPGDRILFYTDGTTESRLADDRLLGESGLAKIVEHLREAGSFNLLDRILEVLSHGQHGPPHDDMTLLVAALK